MLPTEPVVERAYILVRATSDGIACGRFLRFSDGSALFNANGVYAKAIGLDERYFSGGVAQRTEGSALGWKAHWDELMKFGFIELSEAQETGIVPPDWKPDWKLPLPASRRTEQA